jgi:hypothetical protein
MGIVPLSLELSPKRLAVDGLCANGRIDLLHARREIVVELAQAIFPAIG